MMAILKDAGGSRSADQTPSRTVSIDRLPVAAFLLTRDQIVDVNAIGVRMLGAGDRSVVIGQAITQILVFGDPVSLNQNSAKAQDGAPWRHAMLRPVAGSAIPVLACQGPDGTATDGQAALWIVVPAAAEGGVILDVDARQEARGRIADVFANLAHEMRTPLNAVIGFGEILLGEHFGPLASRYKEYSRDIVGAGYHLLALVNGALDLGRASAGPESLDERPVELRTVITSTIGMLQGSAAAKSIAVDVVDLAGLPLVYADETRMRQLFVNLVGNAIKYSAAGRDILIRHRISENDEVIVDVIDGGVGMSRDEIVIAMLPFGRTDSAMRTGEAGTGLGLPICKAIVEAHGGRMIIESAPRRGTTISIVLPANRLVAAPGHSGLLSLL